MRKKEWVIRVTTLTGEKLYYSRAERNWSPVQEAAHGWHYKRDAVDYAEITCGREDFLPLREVIRRKDT